MEAAALERAEIECHADGPVREQARRRAAVARSMADRAFQEKFAAKIAAQYPGCPHETALLITRHACEKYSGRVGRSAAAKEFDAAAVDLAVCAHIRHALTDYERLLGQGLERADARARVAGRVDAVAGKWRKGTVTDGNSVPTRAPSVATADDGKGKLPPTG